MFFMWSRDICIRNKVKKVVFTVTDGMVLSLLISHLEQDSGDMAYKFLK